MKKPYQIEAQRAVKQLAEMATDGNPSVQMVLPLAEMVVSLAPDAARTSSHEPCGNELRAA
jgi:hypothetical protein